MGAAASLARAPESFRAWEWDYLKARSDPARFTGEYHAAMSPAGISDVAYSAADALLLAYRQPLATAV